MISTRMLTRLYALGYTPSEVTDYQATRLMMLENLEDQQGLSKYLGKLSLAFLLATAMSLFSGNFFAAICCLIFSIAIMWLSFSLHEKYVRKSIIEIMGS